MNIFFDGTLEESSERQVRETTPGVIEKSSSIAKPIPEKYEKDIEALRKKYGENFKTGLCIEITLKELLEICPRVHIPEHTRSLSGSLLGYKTIP